MQFSESGSSFLRFSLSEVAGKISLAIVNNILASVWKKGEKSVEYVIDDLRLNKVTLKGDVEKYSQGEFLFFSFILRENGYFFRGEIIEVADGSITLELEDRVFRSDRRKEERLLTFPHYNAYVYFRLEDNNEGNILSFKKTEDGERKHLESFVRDKRLLAGIEEDLIGFRVLDISLNGLSFLTSLSEAKFFSEGREKNLPEGFVFMIEGENFNLSLEEVLHLTDFINPRGSAIPTKKVAVSFRQDADVSAFLDEKLDDGVPWEEQEKEFEEFFEDHGQF